MDSKSPRFVTIFLLTSYTVLAMAGVDLYLPALPTMVNALDSHYGAIQLSIGIYLFGIGVGQLVFGPIIDHFGRRPTIFLSLLCYVIASLGCAATTSDVFLLLMRIMQALSVSICSVVSFSATRDIEDTHERSRIISYLSMAVSISPILAPILGAYLLEHIGWRSIFTLMAIMGLFNLVLTYFYMHESPFLTRSKKLLFFSPYIMVIKELTFWRYTLCIIFAFSSLMTFVFNSSYMFIDIHGISPKNFSYLFAANASMIFVGNYFGIILRRLFHMDHTITIGGLIITLSGIIMIVMMVSHPTRLAIFMIPILLNTLGTVVVLPAASAAAIRPFTDTASTASAFLVGCRLIFSASLAALVGLFYVKHPILLPAAFLILGALIILTNLTLGKCKYALSK